jgi:hypothetical protein
MPTKNATDKKLYPDFNWLDAVFRTVPVQTHNLSLSGGAGGTNYNVILGYVNQPDIMIGTSFKKYNLQLNLGSKINDRISFGSSITLNYGDRKYPRNGSEDQFCLPLVNHHFMDLYYQMVVVVIRLGHILFSPQIKTLLQLLKMHLQD